MTNYAIEYLQETFPERDDPIKIFDGFCAELTDCIIHWMGSDIVSILYIKGPLDFEDECDYWRYHQVPLVNGLVHDAWHPTLILPPNEYVIAAFPRQRPQYEVYR